MLIETKLRPYKPRREKVLPHLKKHLAFLCPECYSWLYLTRDLIEERINRNTGIQYRKFICDSCGEVLEFEGRRGIFFPRKGSKRATSGERRQRKPSIPPELKELIVFKKNLEKALRIKRKR